MRTSSMTMEGAALGLVDQIKSLSRGPWPGRLACLGNSLGLRNSDTSAISSACREGDRSQTSEGGFDGLGPATLRQSSRLDGKC